MIEVLPSLLSADFAHLAQSLELCRVAGAKVLHVDVMDGHFVPNITIGPLVVQALRRSTALTLDVHLMISRPLDYIAAFRQAGADRITIHVEAVGPRRIQEAISAVKALGVPVGLAFNPDTHPRFWLSALKSADFAMLMTVYPGFGGQAFMPEVREHISWIHENLPSFPIQVDGGIDRQTAPLVVSDGVTRLVTGNAFFQAPDQAGFIRDLSAL